MKATLTSSCTPLCRSQAWKRRDSLRFARILNKQLAEQGCYFLSSSFSFFCFLFCCFFLDGFLSCACCLQCKAQFHRNVGKCFWPDLFFKSPTRLATAPQSSMGAAIDSYFWLVEKRSTGVVSHLQKPPCPPVHEMFASTFGRKRKAALAVTHRRSIPLPSAPLAPDAQARLAFVFNFQDSKEVEKSRLTLHHEAARLNTATAAARLSPRCRGSACVPDHKTVFIYMSCSNYAPVQVLTSFIHLLV